MATPMCGESIPSKLTALLNNLVGQKLISLVRYSWSSEEEVVEEYEIDKDEIFSLAPGPLLMYFDSGLVVGSSSDPSKSSIVLWVEKNEKGESIDELTESDEELFPIDAKEQKFWSGFLGEKINSIQIVHKKASSAKMAELASEVGLIVSFENGAEFILSHGLHDNSDDFSVIRREQINDELVSQLDM